MEEWQDDGGTDACFDGEGLNIGNFKSDGDFTLVPLVGEGEGVR